MIWLTSDWHFNHDVPFIWEARGYSSVKEMNEGLIRRHNVFVRPEDTVYVLGDLIMGDNLEEGMKLIRRMNGNLIIIRGNHDSDRRVATYKEFYHVYDALYIKYEGYRIYLSHFPALTNNNDLDKPLKARVLNFFGHTHQTDNFCKENPNGYHVGVDSHIGCPIFIDRAIEELKLKNRGVL